MTRWVVDASPLIFLTKLDRLDLLRRGADEILVPSKVVAEISAGRDDSAGQVSRALGTWLRERPLALRDLPPILKTAGPGEAAAMLLAQQVDADRIVMDDLNARRRARALGLHPVGTLGLLLAARLRDEIPCLRDEIARLRAAGFRVGDALVQAVLAEAGEGGPGR